MIRKTVIQIIARPMQFWAKRYFKKPRGYNYKKIKGTVLPEVFHPHFTISTKLLMQFLEGQDLKNKSFLELGCGTGLISVLAAQKGAKVVSTDINPKAIENVHLNALNNNASVEAIESDLFQNLNGRKFDIIVINPPYYPKAAKNAAEEAWFCGKNFEYFEKLFSQLGEYINAFSRVYMILSEDCDLKRIQEIGIQNRFDFKEVKKQRKWGEWNYIFNLQKN